ncbi:MAG: iron-sulfur cluster co-chaperone HscB C-terminal domain-containing protein [Saprospiraceae bacterium]|nr:iron-sulfur cluster co-chaperone HscB C-terminal domain-containing protein [Saprospiraceae bacterium]
MMNYFDFFEIPLAFIIDDLLLKQRFYEYSKKYHPDFYTLESDEKQAEILEFSTLNNEAYRTLADFDKRMKYILELKGVLAEEGKNEIPQDFLTEIMELNEALMELEFDFDELVYREALQKNEQIESAIFQEVAPILAHYNDQKATVQELFAIKDFYLKKRYLLRIRENLYKFATL